MHKEKRIVIMQALVVYLSFKEMCLICITILMSVAGSGSIWVGHGYIGLKLKFGQKEEHSLWL